MATEPDEFLTVEDVADLLKLNKQTIYNYVDRGELRAVRVGSRRVRIRRSELDRFLAEGTPPPNAEAERPGLAEQDLAAAFAEVGRASKREPAERAAALRDLAAVAERLAAALEAQAQTTEGN